jgi:glycosyltransferase involved in cell wall biosynthesis
VLVLASLWPENSPLTIREATAAGLPVITTTLGGARELASDARLVAPGDIPALVSALEACCARGRHRTRPHRWQTSDEHAIWMLDEVYRGVVSQ